MFSTGLPILYPFASIFFFVLYWVYKILLLKYYKKTSRFNEEIPVESLSYFQFAILLHVLIGGAMISNSNLLQANTDGNQNSDTGSDLFGLNGQNSSMFTRFF